MTLSFTTTLWLGDFEVVDHSALGVARLIWQYRSLQPRLQGALAAFLDDVQSIEDATLEVWAGIWPLTAVGDQLDVIGAIVGQPRGSLLDAPYRLMVLGRIFVNRSDGTTPEIYELLNVTGYDVDSLVRDYYPAAVWVRVVGVDYPTQAFNLVDDLVGGGVLLTFVYSTYDLDETFQASGTYNAEEYDSNTGAGSVYDATVGGHSAGCFR